MESSTSSVPSYCFNESVSSLPYMDTSRAIVFWVEGVAICICGHTGVIGNILTCIVLAKISLKNVFNQLIVTLCVFDTFFCGLALLEYSFKKGFGLISYSTPVYVDLWPKFIYPMQNITYSAALCVTLAIAIERYLAVCHPFFVHQEHTIGSNGSFRKRTLRYLLPALLFAIFINIPKFMEFRNYQRPDNSTYIEATELRLNDNYQFYYINWVRTTLTALLPFLLLAFLNGRIIYQIRKTEKMGAQNVHSAATVDASSKRETKLARILVLLVFTFLFCNLGKLFLNLYDIGNLSKIRQCSQMGLSFMSPFWVVALISLNHLLVVVNASSNLFLFSVIGTQFRATLLAILHLRPMGAQGRNNRRNGSPPLMQRTFVSSHTCGDQNEMTTMV